MRKELIQAINSALAKGSGLKLTPPVCPGSFDGRRTGRQAGGATEFADYRAYREGDELRRVDWRLFARNDQLMVRQFARETDPRCDLILDCSESMSFYHKMEAAAGLGAVFARSAASSGFSLQVWALHDEVLKIEPAADPPAWDLPDTGARSNPPEMLHLAAPGFFRQGLRILISDLLFEELPERVLRLLGPGAAAVVQILGDEELNPALSGRITLTDPETGEEKGLEVDEELLRRYRDNLETFRTKWEESCSSYQALFFTFDAAHLIERWDMAPFCGKGLLQ